MPYLISRVCLSVCLSHEHMLLASHSLTTFPGSFGVSSAHRSPVSAPSLSVSAARVPPVHTPVLGTGQVFGVSVKDACAQHVVTD